jgi:hypothetical protein
MRPNIRWAAAAGLLAVVLVGCTRIEEAAHSAEASYSLEKVANSEFVRIKLQAKAAERLGIETSPVEEITTTRGLRKAIAYGAVIYGTEGQTWAYTNPEPLVYVRQDIAIDFIEGERALLLAGPPAGAAVVTIGVAELYGLENEFGK